MIETDKKFGIEIFENGGVDDFFGHGTYKEIYDEAEGSLRKLMELAMGEGMTSLGANMYTDTQLIAFIANKRLKKSS